MSHSHDLLEARAEDDTESREFDPDKTYCGCCEEEIDDEDTNAIERRAHWYHYDCWVR
jgi:hypothetical protein